MSGAQARPSASPAPVAIRLRPDERWFLLGKTRSGKSYLARYLLEEWERKGWRIVIAGSKGDWVPRGQWEKRGPGTVAKPRLIEAFNPKIAVGYFKVNIPGWRDERFSALCLAILKARNTVFLVDDMDGVASATQIAPGMSQLWTTGGALNIPCLACHQRTHGLPLVIKSQAENWAVFQMTDPDDLIEASHFTGTPAMQPVNRGGIRLPRYWWWYWNVDMEDGAQLMRPIKRG